MAIKRCFIIYADVVDLKPEYCIKKSYDDQYRVCPDIKALPIINISSLI